jgi:hypothetical protein
MHTLNINDASFVDKLAVLKILSSYCEEMPEIYYERDDEKTTWHLKWPIPLIDVADEKEEPVP